MTRTALLIVERGGRWEQWAQAWCGPMRQLILVLQPSSESRRGFCERVLASVERLKREQVALKSVVLVAGPEVSSALPLARAELLRLVRLEFGSPLMTEVLLPTVAFPGDAARSSEDDSPCC